MGRFKDKLLPLSLYGDEVTAYKGTEAGSVARMGFCSDLVPFNQPWLRYFMTAVYSEYRAVEDTFDDILQALVPRLCKMVSREPHYPWAIRGYQWMFSSVQGDLKYLASNFNLFNYRANLCCSRCNVHKNHPRVDMTLADFRPNSGHLETRYGHEEFMAATREQDRTSM